MDQSCLLPGNCNTLSSCTKAANAVYLPGPLKADRICRGVLCKPVWLLSTLQKEKCAQ
jgi:hypothetical protein